MHRYHYRFFSGPTAVGQMAEMMRTHAMPWQHVTVEGTEHIHVSIDALHADAALRECETWPKRAGLSGLSFESIRRESI